MIGGYFNAEKNGRERVGWSVLGNNSEWREFSGFIEDSGLVDIMCKGKRFSWYSGDGKSNIRIDCFHVSNILMDRWGVVG